VIAEEKMKSLVCLALVALLQIVYSFPINDEAMLEFKLFVQDQNKNYETPEEYQYRFQVFHDNLLRAAELNKLHPRAQFGVTIFMDLTPEEFRHNYLIDNFTEFAGDTFDKMEPLPRQELNAELPETFDWTAVGGIVTSVYNQGNCGSCWAFATTENIESMWARAGHGLENLSMQQLVDCDKASDGCGGGSPSNAYQTVMSEGGIDTMASYEYDAKDGACRFSPAHVGARISTWGYISTNDDEEYMAQWTYANGPPAVCVAASTWQTYKGGVIGPSCGDSVDHCVQLTGWTVSSGVTAWVIRNSWGTDWGYSGYCMVEYGDDVCAIGQWCSSSWI